MKLTSRPSSSSKNGGKWPCPFTTWLLCLNTHARLPHCEKWPTKDEPYIRAGSLQRSGFRENPTNFLTFVAR